MKTYPFIGLYTLCRREVGRFMNVYLQTLFAPMITTLLFYFIFSLSVGNQLKLVHNVPFMVFLAPGLIMMSMMQNAFSNPSSSMITSKIMNNIRDVVIAPINSHELTLGYMVGGIIRGLMIGVLTLIVFYMLGYIKLHHFGVALIYAILGTAFLSLLGIIGGIWAEKFDHLAAITNFIIIPMTFLSGTFYTIEHLPGMVQEFAAFNPFYFIIDGFRYAFIGKAESHLMTGIFYILGLDLCLYYICYMMFKKGYKLKS